MRHVARKEAIEHRNADSCVAFEYDTNTPDINIARIEVKGRYPEVGSMVNTEVTELVYVVKGSGSVVVNGKHVLLAEGDVVSILAGEQVHWEGDMSLIIACSPAWYPEQYENT